MNDAQVESRVFRLDAGSEHGVLFEGPYWSQADQSILWVDIVKRVLFAQPLGAAATVVHVFPEKVSSVVEVRGSRELLLTGERHLWLLDRGTGRHRPLIELVGERPGNRCNDAKCDPNGNLWFGTMDDSEQACSGQLWCLTTGGALVSHSSGLGIVNTLAWDKKRSRMYFGDSRMGTIYVTDYKLTPDGPILGRREVFAGPDIAPGVPDGSALDGQGTLWNARWDGACVVGIDPEGRVLHTIETGCRRPTSCAFVGRGLATLAVTTASVGMVESDVGARDGRVLGVEMQVPGEPVPLFQGVLP